MQNRASRPFGLNDTIRQKNHPRISEVKSIDLNRMIPINVYMSQIKVIRCKENDNIFLTCFGLGPCLGIFIYCQFNNGNKIIGGMHTYDGDSQDFISSFVECEILDEMEDSKIIELVESKKFNPKKLNQLIQIVRELPDYNNEPIEISLAGGTGSTVCLNRQKLFCEYIKRMPNINMAGLFLNPFELNEIPSNLQEVSLFLTAGITSTGNIIVCKTHDIAFGYDREKFRDDNAAIKHLETVGIKYFKTQEFKETRPLPCFRYLTSFLQYEKYFLPKAPNLFELDPLVKFKSPQIESVGPLSIFRQRILGVRMIESTKKHTGPLFSAARKLF